MKARTHSLIAAGGATLVPAPHVRRRSAPCRTARVGDAALRPYPKAPDTDSPVFLLRAVGIFFLLLCSVLLAMLALFQDFRRRQHQG
jgi:hypothetical protein